MRRRECGDDVRRKLPALASHSRLRARIAACPYLDGVARAEVGQADSTELVTVDVPGGPPRTPPGDHAFWLASSEGAGTRNLDWRPHDGVWTVVAMNADRSAPVSVDVRAAARLPAQPWIGGGLLALSGLLLAAGVALLAGSIRRASAASPMAYG